MLPGVGESLSVHPSSASRDRAALGPGGASSLYLRLQLHLTLHRKFSTPAVLLGSRGSLGEPLRDHRPRESIAFSFRTRQWDRFLYGSAAGLRGDFQPAIQLLYTFPHACNANTRSSIVAKPTATIFNFQNQVRRDTNQTNVRSAASGVTVDIRQAFLDDTKDRRLDGFRQAAEAR